MVLWRFFSCKWRASDWGQCDSPFIKSSMCASPSGRNVHLKGFFLWWQYLFDELRERVDVIWCCLSNISIQGDLNEYVWICLFTKFWCCSTNYLKDVSANVTCSITLSRFDPETHFEFYGMCWMKKKKEKSQFSSDLIIVSTQIWDIIMVAVINKQTCRSHN